MVLRGGPSAVAPYILSDSYTGAANIFFCRGGGRRWPSL